MDGFDVFVQMDHWAALTSLTDFNGEVTSVAGRTGHGTMTMVRPTATDQGRFSWSRKRLKHKSSTAS